MARKVMPNTGGGNSLGETLHCAEDAGPEDAGPEEASTRRGDRGRRGRKAPAPLTPERLRSAALWYLERYAGSRMALRRFLDRRVRRGEAAGDPAAAEAPEWIAPLIDDFERLGLVDDGKVAESIARSCLGRGESRRRIRARLAAKGIAGDAADAALDAALAERGDADPDRAGALRLAARKRLGPYRPPEQREACRDRDLRAFARQGYGAAIAYWIVDAESPEALENEDS